MLLLVACAATAAPDRFETLEIIIDGQPLTVWFADEAIERQQGLQDVARLPDGIDGMLFAYDEPTPGRFHMKDTLIPLDIWWIDPDGFVIGGARMEPCVAEPCTTYASPAPIGWALEAPADVIELPGRALLSTVESG